MIEFKGTSKEIGRVDVVDLCIINTNKFPNEVEMVPSRPGFKVYFLVKITYSDPNKWTTEVPTGNPKIPYIQTLDEYIVTDLEGEWYLARNLEIVDSDRKPDKKLYINDYDDVQRIKDLSVQDRDHIMSKVQSHYSHLINETNDIIGY